MHTAPQPETARIGPNAVLQHLPVLDDALGRGRRQALMARAGVPEPPPDSGMLDETLVAPLHRAVWLSLPDRAASIQRQAGLAVGDYILTHRIPRPARALIRALPAALGARLLAAAIARHAWTFAGSGRFVVIGHRPLTFIIGQNPLAQGPADPGFGPSCHWHAAVFERLFQSLVWPHARVVETDCCAQGAPACRFVIHPSPAQATPAKATPTQGAHQPPAELPASIQHYS